VIFSSYLKKLIPIAKGALSLVYRNMGADRASAVELDRLYAYAMELLPSLVHEYVKKGVFDNKSFSDFVRKKVSSRIYKKAFEIVKDINELTADAGKYGGLDKYETTLLEGTVNERAFDGIEIKELNEVFVDLLEKFNFNKKQIFIVSSVFLEDSSFDEIENNFNELFHEDLSISFFEETMMLFKTISEKIGFEKMQHFLSTGEIDLEKIENTFQEIEKNDKTDGFLIETIFEEYKDNIVTVKALSLFDFQVNILDKYNLTWDDTIVHIFIVKMLNRINSFSPEYPLIDASVMISTLIEQAA